MTGIDQIAYCSALRDMHPCEKAALAISSILIVLVLDSFFISGVVFVSMSYMIVGKARIKSKLYLKILAIPLGFILLSCLSIAVNVGYQPVDFVYRLACGPLWISASKSSLTHTFTLFAKSLAAISCLNFLALTTPMVQIMYLCRKIKIPSIAIDLMVLIYSNIFIFLEKANHIYIAQLSRCGYQGFMGHIKSLSLLCANLFIKGLKASNESYDCLVSRCFTGQFRVIDDVYEFKIMNLTAILGFDSILFLLYFSGGF